ncbi:hypothetical protein VTI74DRAFT_4168 [Chaetomium olivicolor]
MTSFDWPVRRRQDGSDRARWGGKPRPSPTVDRSNKSQRLIRAAWTRSCNLFTTRALGCCCCSASLPTLQQSADSGGIIGVVTRLEWTRSIIPMTSPTSDTSPSHGVSRVKYPALPCLPRWSDGCILYIPQDPGPITDPSTGCSSPHANVTASSSIRPEQPARQTSSIRRRKKIYPAPTERGATRDFGSEMNALLSARLFPCTRLDTIFPTAPEGAPAFDQLQARPQKPQSSPAERNHRSAEHMPRRCFFSLARSRLSRRNTCPPLTITCLARHTHAPDFAGKAVENVA